MANEIAEQIKEGMTEGLSLQEISWCETFLRTASIRQACKEALMDLHSAMDMLDKPLIKQYILEKSLTYKNKEDGGLDRGDLKKILNAIAQDPTTSPTLRLEAVSKLNSMLEFDLNNKESIIDAEEPEEIKLTAEEADEMLRKIRKEKQ